MYLPLDRLKKSFSEAVYDFVVSTANSVTNCEVMLSNQKSTTRMNLLFTLSNRMIFSAVHSIGPIRLVGWVSFNLNNHPCNNYVK
jgi:hypothetical protein